MQRKTSLKGDLSSIAEIGNIVKLPKGGHITLTEAGPIQFGMPADTIKDSLVRPQGVPAIYILPTGRFDINSGSSLAEFEFPAYYNYFVLKRKIIVVTDRDGERAMREIFQETLLGPASLDSLIGDFPINYPKERIPDLRRELDYFATHPNNPKAKLTFDDLISIKRFDERDEAVFEESKGDLHFRITIRKNAGFFEVLQNDSHLSTFRDEVAVHKSAYLCHRLIEEDRFELVDHVKMPAEDTIIEEEPKITFDPPDFGVTFLGASSGFDPEDSTSGMIVWINQKGVLVDPPAFSTDALHKIGIPPSMIDKVILTHCHADHDSGILQKVLTATAVEIITTPTIMSSFVRKYSAVIGIDPEDLRKLFQFRPVTIGHPLVLYGATFEFYYSLHSIPCICISVKHGGESLFYSSDTLWDPAKVKDLERLGVVNKSRMYELNERKFEDYSLVLHEAGGAPIHTTLESLLSLPEEVRRKMYVYHLPTKNVPPGSGLRKALCGLSNTIVIVKDVTSDSLMRNLEIVSSIDFFEKIPLKRICDLIRCVKEVKYKQSDFIIREGTKGNKFYVVKKGVCKIYTRKPGREFSKFVYPGDHFGESAVMGDGIRLANVVCETDCFLLEINTHDFKWCLGSQFDAGAVGLMKNLTNLRHTNYGEFINKNLFISKLTELQKTDLNMRIEVVRVEQGEMLWNKNSFCEFALFICTGAFELDSPEDYLGKIKLQPGQLVADFPSLIKDQKKTICALKCTKGGDILKIKKPLLLDFLANNPGLFIYIRDKLMVQ